MCSPRPADVSAHPVYPPAMLTIKRKPICRTNVSHAVMLSIKLVGDELVYIGM